MKAVLAGAVGLALAAGAGGWLPGREPLRQAVRLHVAAAVESADESPFGIAAHRAPRLPPARPAAAPAAAAAPSAAATIDRLEASGDPRDAFKAFGLIAKCLHVRERAGAATPPRSDEACRDITSAQIASRRALLDKAASAEVPGAVTAWIGEGPFGDRTALQQRPDDPLVTEWVERAIARVKSAAKRDDIEAIAQLGMLSLNWELDEVDRLKVLVAQAAGRELRQ